MDFSLSDAQTELAGLTRKILAERVAPERGGRTSPRPACSQRGCPSHSAGPVSDSSSSARC